MRAEAATGSADGIVPGLPYTWPPVARVLTLPSARALAPRRTGGIEAAVGSSGSLPRWGPRRRSSARLPTWSTSKPIPDAVDLDAILRELQRRTSAAGVRMGRTGPPAGGQARPRSREAKVGEDLEHEEVPPWMPQRPASFSLEDQRDRVTRTHTRSPTYARPPRSAIPPREVRGRPPGAAVSPDSPSAVPTWVAGAQHPEHSLSTCSARRTGRSVP